jgi:hypothetical protein
MKPPFTLFASTALVFAAVWAVWADKFDSEGVIRLQGLSFPKGETG